MTGRRPFARVAAEVAALVEEKNRAYGDSAGNAGAILRVLAPSGISPERYDDVLLVIRVLDKLSRIMHAPEGGDAMNEDPWRDVLGYAILACARGEDEPIEEESEEPRWLLSRASEFFARCAKCGVTRQLADVEGAAEHEASCRRS